MKNVIITGSSRGIGFELVKIFSEKDFNVITLSRNIEPISDLNLKNFQLKAVACITLSQESRVTRQQFFSSKKV